MDTPPTRSEPDTSLTNGTVKWYDKDKGYGFISASDLNKDVLLHENVLKAHCFSSIADGASISFGFEETQSGYRATSIGSVEAAPTNGTSDHHEEIGTLWEQAVPARVKWFDMAKGYGFVNQFGSSDDIFIGRDALERSAMQSVGVGEALCVTIDRKSVV